MLTFACPLCGRRMGVGSELGGRSVRCPHCKQVVVAPTAAPAPAAASESIFHDPGRPPDAPGSSSVHHEAEAEPASDAASFSATADTSDQAAAPTAPNPKPASVSRPGPFAVPLPTPSELTDPLAFADPDRPPAGRPWVLWLLALYAALATAAAAWGWLRGGDRGHPLLFVPDLFGEYRKASRERVADLPRLVPALNDPVPPELTARLGQTLALGTLDVQPLSIEQRTPTRVTEFAANAGEPDRRPTRGPCLLLTMRVTNRSPDTPVHPLDPAFNRAATPDAPPPLSGLVLPDGTRAMGGPFRWPLPAGFARVYLDGQRDDADPLRPGESRDYVLPSADDRTLCDRVGSAAGPVRWHVHVRRGLTRVRGEDLSVAAVFAVSFDADQVQSAADDRR